MLRWYRQDRAYVEGELRAGRRPDMAATTALGPLDELVALHEEVGAFAALTDVSSGRGRASTTRCSCGRWRCCPSSGTRG